MSWTSLFADRNEAGDRLARRLVHLRSPDTVVVGLPRGGVPVAAQVATALGAPLDVIVVRKVGAPGNPELAIGAVGEGGVLDLDASIREQLGVTEQEVDAAVARGRAELTMRVLRFRGGRPRHALEGRTVIVVDDGIATGSTMRAACRVARADGAAHVVVAVPCAPPGWEDDLAGCADELIALSTPEPYFAVNQWYGDFSQVSDDQVVALLDAAAQHAPASPAPSDTPSPPRG